MEHWKWLVLPYSIPLENAFNFPLNMMLDRSSHGGSSLHWCVCVVCVYVCVDPLVHQSALTHWASTSEICLTGVPVTILSLLHRYTHACMRTRAHTHLYMQMHKYTQIYRHTPVPMHLSIHVCTCTNVHTDTQRRNFPIFIPKGHSLYCVDELWMSQILASGHCVP